MSHYPTPRQRTKRAFGAYMEVLETADWLKGELHGPLLMYDLSMGDFRLLELLHREGAHVRPGHRAEAEAAQAGRGRDRQAPYETRIRAARRSSSFRRWSFNGRTCRRRSGTSGAREYGRASSA